MLENRGSLPQATGGDVEAWEPRAGAPKPSCRGLGTPTALPGHVLRCRDAACRRHWAKAGITATVGAWLAAGGLCRHGGQAVAGAAPAPPYPRLRQSLISAVQETSCCSSPASKITSVALLTWAGEKGRG